MRPTIFTFEKNKYSIPDSLNTFDLKLSANYLLLSANTL